MPIKAHGQALVSSATDGTLHDIDAADLEWEVIGSDDRSMGPEVLYRASLEHPELGEIGWVISEYPTEALNHVTPEMNGNLLLEDLVFWYEHEPDEDYYESESRPLVRFSTKELMEASSERQIEMLVAWFRSRYEDPAQETPYNGREGGYQYIAGGPYDARDELDDNFSGLVSEKAIEAAVEEIESDGIHEWAPIRHSQPDDDRDFDNPTNIADFNQMLQAGARANSDDPAILAARAEALRNAAAFLEILRSGQPQHGGIGHNGPPVDEAGNILPPGFYQELEANAEQLVQALAQDVPDLPSVTEAGVVLERRLSWIIRPLPSSTPPAKGDSSQVASGAKSNKFTDAFNEQMGKNVANVVTNAAVIGLTFGGGFLLNTILPGLGDLVGSLLNYLILKIQH
jgi:hypothetical protein